MNGRGRLVAALMPALVAGLFAGLPGCTGSAAAPTATSTTTTTSTTTARPPAFPAAAPFDYQIGGSFTPDAAVRIVTRDRAEEPAPGRYNICYLNAFQAQPDARAWWTKNYPHLLLRDARGRLVIDRDWNEPLLDIRTDHQRAQLAGILKPWISGCAASGFNGVEFDNLDSFTRSGGLITSAQTLAFAGDLVRLAHSFRLTAGQKNTAELTSSIKALGFDFAVAEECQTYAECDSYRSAYGKQVLEIEYEPAAFAAACRARKGQVSITLRDREVSARGSAGFVDRRC